MRMIEYPLVLVMASILKIMETVCEAWVFVKEYKSMRRRGYTLMKNEDGEMLWVGYGD